MVTGAFQRYWPRHCPKTGPGGLSSGPVCPSPRAVKGIGNEITGFRGRGSDSNRRSSQRIRYSCFLRHHSPALGWGRCADQQRRARPQATPAGWRHRKPGETCWKSTSLPSASARGKRLEICGSGAAKGMWSTSAPCPGIACLAAVGCILPPSFAVRSLTEGLRQELRQAGLDIRVSSISPGFVETEFAAQYHQSQEQAESLYSQFPVLQPEDIANTVAYILTQPDHVQIHDVLMRPTQQQS